ncbi:MAG: hypothetical protein AAGH83_05545, partial [Pseudomonadota bacterium]
MDRGSLGDGTVFDRNVTHKGQCRNWVGNSRPRPAIRDARDKPRNAAHLWFSIGKHLHDTQWKSALHWIASAAALQRTWLPIVILSVCSAR